MATDAKAMERFVITVQIGRVLEARRWVDASQQRGQNSPMLKHLLQEEETKLVDMTIAYFSEE